MVTVHSFTLEELNLARLILLVIVITLEELSLARLILLVNGI